MKLKNWKELPEGAIIKNTPTSPEFKTGEWKTKEPYYHAEKCTHCLLCWLYCPDSVITVKNKKIDVFLLEYCKGCGICAKICPVNAIEMREVEL